MEPEEIEMQDFGPPEEEPYEDSWGAVNDDFERFLDGPRQFYGVDPVSNSYKTTHARSERNYEAKQEILYKLFGQVFDRSFGDEQTFFLNKTKLIIEDIGPNHFVKYLEYEGERVASYEGGRYEFSGNYSKFAQDALASQDAFSETPMGRYRDYLVDEEGLIHITPERLRELYDFRRTEESWVKFRRTGLFDELEGEIDLKTFGPSSLERFEKFKKMVRIRVPIISTGVILLATLVFGLVFGLRAVAQNVTKSVAKNKHKMVDVVRKSPMAALSPAVKVAADVTEQTSGFMADHLWVLVVVPVVGYFLYKKWKART